MTDIVIITYRDIPPTYRHFKNETNAMAYYHSITKDNTDGWPVNVYRYMYNKCIEQREVN
jgi:hypothetical protein